MLQFYVHATMTADPLTQPPYTITINDDIWPTSTTTQRWLLTHQLNHTTQLLPWPSTMTATSQPTQPLAQHDDHQQLQQLAKSLRRLESATAASNGQVANRTQAANGLKSSWPQPQYDYNYHMRQWTVSPPFFFVLFLFLYWLYLYKQYTNRLPHDKLTTTTSSRNSNNNRTPATAAMTVTRIPAAEAAAEVVAAAAAATWVLSLFFSFSIFFCFFFFVFFFFCNSELQTHC